MAERILIVDDDKEFCEELAEVLRDAGFDTEYVFHPLVAKTLLQKNIYDVVLLDFKMPQLNAIEFLEGIKKNADHLKIFVLSGTLSVSALLEEHKLKPFIAGVIHKPFDVETLLKNIRGKTRP